jgi:CheY-like chemotaxis protein
VKRLRGGIFGGFLNRDLVHRAGESTLTLSSGSILGVKRQILHPAGVAEPADLRQDSRSIPPRRSFLPRSATYPGFAMPTVLLVDDESSVRSALRKVLERSGLTVVEADSGRGALEAIASDPGISAVVSDFLMPEINGLDFYDAMVAQSPHLRERVVFLTGAARDPRVHQPLEQRGVPLISKLDDLQIVLDAVKLALLRRQ